MGINKLIGGVKTALVGDAPRGLERATLHDQRRTARAELEKVHTQYNKVGWTAADRSALKAEHKRLVADILAIDKKLGSSPDELAKTKTALDAYLH